MRFLLFISILFFLSCHQRVQEGERNVERSFYYWRTVFRLSQQEKAAFDSLKLKTLYIKFFDLAWDAGSASPVPVAQLRAPDSNYLRTSGLNIIPVIFITNECIYKMDSSSTATLANKIHELAESIAVNNSIQHIKEIQIDCDWTAKTKDKYFSLLRNLKTLYPSAELSTTIRMHQVKYSSQTGIPPVSRGMLMCYNMGNLTDIKTRNSILETQELDKYSGSLQKYPLPLDLAYPLFEWNVLFRNEKFVGLVDDMPESILSDTGIFSKQGNRFVLKKDTVLAGYVLQKNDLLRNEHVSASEIRKAEEIINEKLVGKNTRVAFYHSDTLILKKYSIYEMENIYDGMR